MLLQTINPKLVSTREGDHVSDRHVQATLKCAVDSAYGSLVVRQLWQVVYTRADLLHLHYILLSLPTVPT